MSKFSNWFRYFVVGFVLYISLLIGLECIYIIYINGQINKSFKMSMSRIDKSINRLDAGIINDDIIIQNKIIKLKGD
jgi:hypothetical protein